VCFTPRASPVTVKAADFVQFSGAFDGAVRDVFAGSAKMDVRNGQGEKKKPDAMFRLPISEF
jgi:hypothetical protein